MKITRFDPAARLIIVRGSVWGRQGDAFPLRLVLDTGAAETVLSPGLLDDAGYNPRQGEAITTTRSAVGTERGYFIRVPRFRALGFELRDFRVDAHDLPEGFDIDGLLGLSFLRQFNYEVRSGEGRILADRRG